MATNRAAWLDGAAKKLRIDEADMPKPESDEIVIKNSAIAINPVDCTYRLTNPFPHSPSHTTPPS